MELTLVNVGENTTLGDGDVAEELVQLLIVADGELEVTGDDTGLLVVASGVASQLEDLGGEVFEDGGEVHWRRARFRRVKRHGEQDPPGAPAPTRWA